MIVAGSDIGVWIDFGSDEPGMILQREYREGGLRVWRDDQVDGKPVTAPVSIEALPVGVNLHSKVQRLVLSIINLVVCLLRVHPGDTAYSHRGVFYSSHQGLRCFPRSQCSRDGYGRTSPGSLPAHHRYFTLTQAMMNQAGRRHLLRLPAIRNNQG